MSKFWSFVGAVIVVSVVLLATGDSKDTGISFTDLETECRYDRGNSVSISLEKDNSLSFRGNFPVQDTHAELGYSYSQTPDSVTLDVSARQSDRPGNFSGSCLGSVVYDSRTAPLPPGEYLVEVKHDGKTRETVMIEVK